jgi:hypothetical protein
VTSALRVGQKFSVALLAGVAIAAAIMSLPAQAQPASGEIAVMWPPRLSKTANAVPRLRDANTPARRRINAALEIADDRLRNAISQCANDARDNRARGSKWDRTVEITMAGPELFLAWSQLTARFVVAPIRISRH